MDTCILWMFHALFRKLDRTGTGWSNWLSQTSGLVNRADQSMDQANKYFLNIN